MVWWPGVGYWVAGGLGGWVLGGRGSGWLGLVQGVGVSRRFFVNSSRVVEIYRG